MSDVVNFRRLHFPPEILSNIFLYTLDDEPVPFGLYVYHDNRVSPMSISHVCREWRSVSTSLPGLWSSVWVTIGKNMKAEPLCKLWLERSQSAPLSLRIKETKYCFSLDHITKIFALYLPHIDRWHSLILVLRHVPSNFIEGIENLRAPRLENFALNLKEDEWKINAFSTLIQSAPRLRRLWYTNSGFAPNIVVPAQISQISLRCVNCNDCLEILRHTEQLEECRLSVSFYDTRPANPPRLRLGKLRHLNITSFTDGIGCILGSFELPALRFLWLDGRTTDETLTQLLYASQCPLETLRLWKTETTEEALVECLEMVSSTLIELNIEQAYLGRSVVTDRTLTRLTCPDMSSDVFCPKLTTFKVRGLYSDYSESLTEGMKPYGDAIVSSDGTLAKMLLSRIRAPGHLGVACFTEVRCWFDAELGLAHKMDIEQLEDAKAANLLENVYIQLSYRFEDIWPLRTDPSRTY